ncbi:MAG: hypothetical protein ABFR95_10485 [Actinomycetota bacterium]
MTTLSINDFTTETTSTAPDRIMPQRAGSALWRPMFVMALMGFAVGFILSIVRAGQISAGGEPLQIAALGQYVSAAMFFGFAAVFAAISFAIAKILGEFRVGGGSVQEAAHSDVKTLKMPGTAKAFIILMAMAMMIILAAVVAHVVAGISIASGDWSATTAEQWTIWLEAARRFGVVLYLFAITFGLVTIAKVIRFQTFRIRQVADRV